MRKTFFKISRDMFPQFKDRFPLIYLEHGRIEVDDSSVKWVGAEKEVFALPIATISTILLGPGTTISHEAVKAISSSNTMICWVGDDSLRFYAAGLTPTSDTRNLIKQMRLSCNPASRLEVARRMFSKRFPGQDLKDKNLSMLMGMEGVRVRALYLRKATEYGVSWSGRRYVPGKIEQSDPVNRVMTFCNSLLYSIITSAVISQGFDPRIGFIHSGSPLPFIYDLADLYKEDLSIDFAFKVCSQISNVSLRNDHLVEKFVENAIDRGLMEDLSFQLCTMFEGLEC